MIDVNLEKIINKIMHTNWESYQHDVEYRQWGTLEPLAITT